MTLDFRNPEFLASSVNYELAERYWEDLWQIATRGLGEFDWKTKWLSAGSIQDGNPIFSSISPSMRRAVRIIQHPPTTPHWPEFVFWIDSVGADTADEVIELVVSCAPAREFELEISTLLGTWANGLPISYDSRFPRTPALDSAELGESTLSATIVSLRFRAERRAVSAGEFISQLAGKDEASTNERF